MKTNYLKLLFLSVLVVNLVSCSSDSDDKGGNEAPVVKYEDFVDANMENVLTKQLNITINNGTNPPMVEGTYIAEPFKCKKSNFIDGFEGDIFGSTELKMFNQNNKRNSIDFESLLTYLNNFPLGYTKEKWDGNGCFISGEDNKFSIFFHSDGTLISGGKTAKYKNLVVVSGEVDKDGSNAIKGIKNFQMASVMADDFGDVNNMLVAVGQGRLFIDSNLYSNIK